MVQFELKGKAPGVDVIVGYDEMHEGYFIQLLSSSAQSWNSGLADIIDNHEGERGIRMEQLLDAYEVALLSDTVTDLGGYIEDADTTLAFLRIVADVPEEVAAGIRLAAVPKH